MNDVQATRSNTFVRNISTTGRILQRQLWLWPLFAAVGLTLVGWLIHSSVESAIKQKLAEELKTILRSELAALDIWLETRKEFVHALAIAPVTKPLVIAQIELAAQSDTTDLDLLQSESLGTLRGHLAMFLEPLGYDGFLVFDRERRIVAADSDQAVGQRSLPVTISSLTRCWAAKSPCRGRSSAPCSCPTTRESSKRGNRPCSPLRQSTMSGAQS